MAAPVVAVPPRPGVLSPDHTRASLALAVFILWAASLAATLWLPQLSWVAIVAISLLAVRAKQKTILFAILISAIITLYGSAGDVAYLGVTAIPEATVAAAMNFYLFMAGGAFIASLSRDPRPLASFRATHAWTLIAVAATIVLIVRFGITGIPLLAGNDGRLIGVAGMPPIVGLASGVLPIATAYIPAPPGGRSLALKSIVVLLVFGTGSRLLLAAVLLGFIYQAATAQRAAGRGGQGRRRLIVAVGAAALVFAVIRIYEIRTDANSALIWEGRTSGVDGLAGLITSIIGPSIYFAARNGLVVFEIMQHGAYAPPGGFIFGGLANTFAVGHDPERWLTQALGLDVLTTGAVATPIWSGATVDFGSLAPLAALIMGVFLARWGRAFPNLTPWIAFAVVLSSYGSYLVSAQFVTASLIMTVILLFSRPKQSGHRSKWIA